MITLFALLAATPGARASVYELQPGADLANVLSTLVPGDEVVLADGLYPVTDTLTISAVDAAAAAVVVRGEAGAVLQAAAREDGSYPSTLLRVEGSSGVRLEGFTVQGHDAWATDVDHRYTGVHVLDSTDVAISGLRIVELTGSGVYVSGLSSAVTVERTEIARLQYGHGVYVGCYDASCLTSGLVLDTNLIHDIGGVDTYAISLQPGTQGAVLSDNIIYNVEYRGLESGSTEFGDPNLIEGNAIWNIADIAMVLRGAALVRNNVVFNITGRGLVCRDPERGDYRDQVIVYNTIVNTGSWGLDVERWLPDSGHVVANNAICNPVGAAMSLVKTVPEGVDPATEPTPARAVHNVACGLVQGFDLAGVEVLPGGGFLDFEDPSIWDFYPTVDSLLIDAADPDGNLFPPELDFSGFPREGDAPDVGAFEWVAEGNPGWPLQEGFKEYLELEEDVAGEAVEGGCCKDGKSADGALLVLPLLGFGGLRRRRRRAGR